MPSSTRSQLIGLPVRVVPAIATIVTLVGTWDAASLGVEPEDEPVILFSDVTLRAGIDFVQTIGDDEMSNIVESAGVGCGFLDYDGDGWLDIYLVNGHWREGLSDPNLDPALRNTLTSATDRLFRNRGDGTFEDVTTRAGIANTGYGMGVVVADYDADGDPDVYVTNYGPNFLYRNNGNGTFTDVAGGAGVDDPKFSVGAVFLDYNRDGWLDLYVGHYVDYDPDKYPEYKYYHAPDGFPGPRSYDGQQDMLFSGNASGGFVNVTDDAGIKVEPVGKAMGVSTFDYDRDGFADVFVSNDAMENFLLRNKGDGVFENLALDAGVAFGAAGEAAASMAAEIADYDGDGLFDLLVPDMTYCALYHNVDWGFTNDSAVSRIAGACARYHSWAGVFGDYDLDGHLDLYMSNGAVNRLEAHPDLVFLGDGRGRFRNVTEMAGDWVKTKYVSRGVARGDFDNDGDLDLLVGNLNSRPVLLRNDTPRRGRHWISVQLVGASSNRDAIGAIVSVKVGPHTMNRLRTSGGSYLSQHDSRLHFGLGGHGTVDLLEVTWPGGTRQTMSNVPADRLVTIREDEQ